MIISYSRKFIFIHAVKTGGTSIGKALAPFINDGDIISGYPIENPDWPKHSWAKHCQTRLDLDKFWSFGFVRNPWDRLVSNFFWWQQVDKTNWDLTHYNRVARG